MFDIELTSTSRATDAGYLALADMTAVAQQFANDYRLIGGHSITILTHVYNVESLTPARETVDVDFGATSQVVSNSLLRLGLISRGYQQIGGNRFIRAIKDHAGELQLAIDILTPAFRSHILNNQQCGELYVDAIPALGFALARAPVSVRIKALLTNGQQLRIQCLVPDLISSLCIKTYCFQGRLMQRDALDMWRLLEAIQGARMKPGSWPHTVSVTETLELLRRYFGAPTAPAPKMITSERKLQAHIRSLTLATIEQATENPTAS